MPFVQFGVRLDDLGVLQESVAEIVADGGDGEDATQTFIQCWLCHDFVLLWSESWLDRGLPVASPFNGYSSLFVAAAALGYDTTNIRGSAVSAIRALLAAGHDVGGGVASHPAAAADDDQFLPGEGGESVPL